jgi:hypothetical protein
MQSMFLLYHYFHGVELYNAIRVMIAGYVWMTGFGNFSFFYTKGDYSLVRVLQMLWRLNFLAIFLCLTQGTPYMLYYICLLHTYFFFVVYLTMRIAKDSNYSASGIRMKLAVLAGLVFLMWDLDDGLFTLVHGMFLGRHAQIGATGGTLWEWYFRSTLDHWSTIWGMVFALNYPVTSLFWRRVESLPLWRHVAVKVVFALVLLLASTWWVSGPFREEKTTYNHTHAYYAVIPLMTFIFLRNLTPWLRSHSLDLLQRLGKTTLETYLMQHHIWMTSNSKTLLTLIPGYPKVNFLLVTLTYVLLSQKLFRLTMIIRGFILPGDLRACLQNSVALIAAFFSCFLGVFFLKEMKMLSLLTVGIMSMTGGSILYTSTMYHAWSAFAEEPGVVHKTSRKRSRTISHVMGTLALLFLGSTWGWLARNGAAKVVPLPSTCAEHVQRGTWAPVDPCNEISMGQSYREHNLSSFGTCIPQSATYVWGWEAAPSSSLCRMSQRSSKSIRTSLAQRTVTFVGDSILRHLYHATCRQAGDKKAGMYNTTTGKWGNFSRQYDGLDLEFRWAPYTSDTLVSTLRSLFEDEERVPDAVVVGGGAWDQLHRNRNETDRKSLVDGIQQVVERIRVLTGAGVSVLWVVPTTINTWGLLTEEKHEWLREDQMILLRQLYKDNGIHDAAHFVLEGSSFTTDRVGDSYDGVHYPLEVYDAGAQIILNSFDWLLPPLEQPSTSIPRPGSMAHPSLGLLTLILVCLAIFSLDSFVGVSYLASLLAPEVFPPKLYQEAYSLLHQQKKIPSLQVESSSCLNPYRNTKSPTKKRNGRSKHSDGSDMVELMEDVG